MNTIKLYNLIIIIFLSSFLISEDNKPKIALVLSGGAAKGYAHIPVLEMLDSLNINIDMIVGTSIGANVGSLYSVGYNAKEILSIAERTDWGAIFLEETNRHEMSYLHKKDESKYQIDFNLKGLTPSLPSGIVYGQKAYIELSKILGPYEYINDFNNFYIPFYCNASDLISGKDIILKEGSIVTSIRASTSIPSIFAPVDYNNYLLVDGGVTNNVPVNIAKSLGADIVLAVTVASSKPDREQIKSSIVDILGESIFIHSSDLTKKNLELADYTLSIKIPKGSSANFTERGLNNIYIVGKKQVYENIDLFLSLQKIAGPKKNRSKPQELDSLNISISNINIYGNKNFNTEYIKNNLGFDIGDTLKLNNIHNGINNLYGLGYFNTVRYELEPESNLKKTNFNIFVEESNFNKLQTGLRWDDHHELIAVANMRFNDIIYPGLLIENEFQFPGIVKNTFEVSYPQTILNNPFYPFYRNTYDKKDIDWYNVNGEKDIEYTSRTINNSLGAGFIIGKNLGIELSANHEISNLSSFPIQELSEDYNNQTTNTASLIIDFDSRDNALITRDGALANIKLLNSEYNNQNYQSLIIDFDIYKTLGRNTFRINFLSRSIGDEALFHNTLFKGKADRNIGYYPYFLNSNKLESFGLEWKYHYKSLYIRLFYNTILKLNQKNIDFTLDEPIDSYGLGLTLKSPFGPIDLVWGTAPKTLISNKTHTLFYVNIGYKF